MTRANIDQDWHFGKTKINNKRMEPNSLHEFLEDIADLVNQYNCKDMEITLSNIPITKGPYEHATVFIKGVKFIIK
jgi:hypothetical protein